MAITFSSGFNVTSMEPIDVRLVMTKEQMLTQVYAKMPETYITICCDEDEDKGKIFIFNKSNEKDPVTGKFRKFDPGLDPRIDEILIRLDKDEEDIEQALAEIKELNQYLDDNYYTKYDIDEKFESKADLADDLAVELPGALIKAMEEQKDELESAMSGVLPGALAKALENQSNPNSGLVVDEDGNIAVSLNEEHLEIIDNKIDLALELIQAIDGNE